MKNIWHSPRLYMALDAVGLVGGAMIGDTVDFTPGVNRQVSAEDRKLARRIAAARRIRVKSVKLRSTLPPWVYRVALTSLRELTLPDIQRLLDLGCRAADLEDAAESRGCENYAPRPTSQYAPP